MKKEGKERYGGQLGLHFISLFNLFITVDASAIYFVINFQEDFLALEVDGGYPVLTMDLGSGPQKIRNPKYVADDQWHKATVDRVGKTVRFTISEEDQNQQITEFPSEGYIQGPKSLFNVDRNSSKLYVGGIPPEEVKSPVRHTSFRGVIEDLVIGDEKVGLWNFKEGQSLNPAYERLASFQFEMRMILVNCIMKCV